MKTKFLLALITAGIIALSSIPIIAEGYTYQRSGSEREQYHSPMIRTYTSKDYQSSANVYIDYRYYGKSPITVTVDGEKRITIKDLTGYKECTVIVKPDGNDNLVYLDFVMGCAAVTDHKDLIKIYLQESSTTTTTLPPSQTPSSSTGYTYQNVRTVKVTPNNIRVNVGTTKFRINKNTGSVTRKTGTAWNYKKTATITGNLISTKLKGTQVTLNKNTGRVLYTKKA